MSDSDYHRDWLEWYSTHSNPLTATHFATIDGNNGPTKIAYRFGSMYSWDFYRVVNDKKVDAERFENQQLMERVFQEETDIVLFREIRLWLNNEIRRYYSLDDSYDTRRISLEILMYCIWAGKFSATKGLFYKVFNMGLEHREVPIFFIEEGL